MGRFEDDEAGNLVRVDERQRTVAYPHARVARDLQAKGELPAGAAGGGEGKGKARRAGAVVLPGS